MPSPSHGDAPSRDSLEQRQMTGRLCAALIAKKPSLPSGDRDRMLWQRTLVEEASSIADLVWVSPTLKTRRR